MRSPDALSSWERETPTWHLPECSFNNVRPSVSRRERNLRRIFVHPLGRFHGSNLLNRLPILSENDTNTQYTNQRDTFPSFYTA
eukprot:4293124-Prymnesium_polylepis.1